MRGLPPRIQSSVIQRELSTLQEAVQAARLALEAQRITNDTTIEATTDSMAAMLTGCHIGAMRGPVNNESDEHFDVTISATTPCKCQHHWVSA